MLYFSTDGCINKSLTYLLTYLLYSQPSSITINGYRPRLDTQTT